MLLDSSVGGSSGNCEAWLSVVLGGRGRASASVEASPAEARQSPHAEHAALRGPEGASWPAPRPVQASPVWVGPEGAPRWSAVPEGTPLIVQQQYSLAVSGVTLCDMCLHLIGFNQSVSASSWSGKEGESSAALS